MPVTGAEVYAEDGYYAVVPEWVLDADVSSQAIRLYCVLRRFADQRTMHAHPSRRVLADRLRVSDVKVVDRALADLRRIGAVTVYPRMSDDGDRSSNGYLLHRAPREDHQETTEGGGRKGMTPGRLSPQGGGRNAPRVGVEKGEEPQPVEPQPLNHSQPPTPAAAGGTDTLPLDGLPEQPQRHNPRTNGTELFDAFWTAYPKKVGKDAARRAWAKAVRRADPDKIIAVARSYPWRTDRQFVKDPATWLNAGCWEDDLDVVAAANREPARTGSGRTQWVLPERGSYDAGDGTF